MLISMMHNNKFVLQVSLSYILTVSSLILLLYYYLLTAAVCCCINSTRYYVCTTINSINIIPGAR